MKYKCCKYLFNQIVFDMFEIKPCCGVALNNELMILVDNFKGDTSDVLRYLDKRKEVINLFKSGVIPDCCKDCPMIEEKEWQEENLKFNRIISANITKCSCNCVYCVYTHDHSENKKMFNKRKSYDIKPLLTYLKNNNLIEEKLFLCIGGGECSEFPNGELKWLIDFTSSYDGYIQFLSSGIKYSKDIEKKLEKGSAEIIISPDSGCAKTYEKIKRVRAFDSVWNNIKKYSAAAKKSNMFSRTLAKYIIVPPYNDNITEFELFIKCCEKAKCNIIHIDIDHFWYRDNKHKEIPQSIKDIMSYLKDLKDFEIQYSAETEYYFDKLKDLDNNASEQNFTIMREYE